MTTISLQTTKAAWQALVILCAAIIFSCSGDDDSSPEPEPEVICRIASYISNGEVASLTYNSEGKLQSFTLGDVQRNFLYSNNTIIVHTTKQGNFNSKTISDLNKDGLVTNILTEYNEAGTDWSNQALEYDGKQVIKITQSHDGGGAASITTYTWQNGNVVSVFDGSSAQSLEYFEEHAIQPGDYYHLLLYTNYGVMPFANKNLIKSIDAGNGDVVNLDYEFDEDGKITTLNVLTSSGSEEYSLQYQCD